MDTDIPANKNKQATREELKARLALKLDSANMQRSTKDVKTKKIELLSEMVKDINPDMFQHLQQMRGQLMTNKERKELKNAKKEKPYTVHYTTEN